MELLREPKINFIGVRVIPYSISALLLVVGILTLIIKKGPKLGVDFTGGTLVQIHVERDIDISQVRSSVLAMGIRNPEIQNFGEKKEFLIRFQEIRDINWFKSELEKRLGTSIRVDRTETVGPRVGKELRAKAFTAILISLLLMLIYISIRFDYKLGTMAVLALFHDVFITFTFLNLLNKEITIPIIAAFLTIVGYSINDSIIISDRIRENLKKFGTKLSAQRLEQIFNQSINQTLSRTILTSGTTLLVLLILMVFGGPVIFDFSMTLFLGILVGTYSSIYIVASPVVDFAYLMSKRKKS